MTRLLVDVADFVVGLVAVLFLLTCVGCGQERPLDTSAAEPRPGTGERPPPPDGVTRLEVCAVTLHDDGTVSCKCEVAP